MWDNILLLFLLFYAGKLDKYAIIVTLMIATLTINGNCQSAYIAENDLRDVHHTPTLYNDVISKNDVTSKSDDIMFDFLKDLLICWTMSFFPAIIPKIKDGQGRAAMDKAGRCRRKMFGMWHKGKPPKGEKYICCSRMFFCI